MSDVKSVSTILEVGSATTVVKPKRKKPQVNTEAARGGLRWTAEEKERIYDHRNHTKEQTWYRKCECETCKDLRRSGEMPKKSSPYSAFEEKYQKSDQACRLIIWKIGQVTTAGGTLKEALAASPPRRRALAKRKQAVAEEKACFPESAPAGEPLSGQASEPVSAEALPTEDALAKEAQSVEAPNPQQLTLAEEILRFRTPEGARVDLPPTPPDEEVLEAATALMGLMTQEQPPGRDTPPRKDSFAPGTSWGQLEIPGPSTSSQGAACSTSSQDAGRSVSPQDTGRCISSQSTGSCISSQEIDRSISSQEDFNSFYVED